MANKYTKAEIEGIIKNLKEKEKKARSKWGKAVLQDAQWLLENVIERYDEPYELSEELVLDGAENWNRFSWDGYALIYDVEIATHYSTPSELKNFWGVTKNSGVKRNVNTAGEHLLDIQARALRQAWWAIRDEMNGTTEFSMSLCNFSYQDVEGHYDGTENFKVIENNKDRIVIETDSMRSVWTFDGNNVVKYETTDKTSGKKIESKDSTSYFKKSQGLTEEYKGNEKIATFKTPKRTYTYDFNVGKLIDEKGNPANANDMGKLLSNESSEICDNIRKSVNQIEDELKKYGHLKMAKKDEVFATIKDSLAKTNLSMKKNNFKIEEDEISELKQKHGQEYLQEKHPDDMIYPMDEIDELFSSVWDALRGAFFGGRYGYDKDSFNPNDDYFYFDGYGNLVSVTYLDEYLDNEINDDDFIEWCKEQGYYKENEDDEGEDKDNFGLSTYNWIGFDEETKNKLIGGKLDCYWVSAIDKLFIGGKSKILVICWSENQKYCCEKALNDDKHFKNVTGGYGFPKDIKNYAHLSVYNFDNTLAWNSGYFGKKSGSLILLGSYYRHDLISDEILPHKSKWILSAKKSDLGTYKRANGANYTTLTEKFEKELKNQFSILDDTKDVLRATGKLAGNIVKNTTDKGGLLMF